MRDRDQRLRWIESLIGGNQLENSRRNALVIPTSIGNTAIEFSAIVEVLSAANVRPLAFLPGEFCGVIRHGSSLVPVIDTGSTSGNAAHVVVVKGGGCLLGLRFLGTPFVVDLEETPYVLLETSQKPRPSRGKLPLLDVEKAIEALLAKE